MNNLTDEQLRKIVRKAIAPMSNQEPQQDMWPQLLIKLGDPGIRIQWFDFILVAIVVILCVFFPEAITGLLFNL